MRAVAGSIADAAVDGSVRIGESLAGKAFLRGEPLKVDNIEDDTQLCPFAAGSGIRSILAVPLKGEGNTTGVLQIGSLRESAFSAREWGLIQVLADRASHAVQNSMLHDQTRGELARVALLRDVAAACAGTHDLKLIAQQALAAVYEQMGCVTAGIFFHDRQSNALINLAFLGHSDSLVKDLGVIEMDRDTLLNKAVIERDVITHDNWPILSETQAQVLADLGALDSRRAALPIIYKNEVVGGMALTMPGQEPWSSAELDTLKGIANQMAVAIYSNAAPSFDISAASLEPAD